MLIINRDMEKGGRMKRSWVIGLIILLGMAGCGKDSSSGPEPMTAEDYVNQGWDLYEAASFNDALDSFSEAAGSDEWGREAAVGTAWAYLRLDNTASAKVSFTSAAALGTGTDLRINVGLGAIALMENNETEAILQLAAHRTGTDSTESSWPWTQESVPVLWMLWIFIIFWQKPISWRERQGLKAGRRSTIPTDGGRSRKPWL